MSFRSIQESHIELIKLILRLVLIQNKAAFNCFSYRDLEAPISLML